MTIYNNYVIYTISPSDPVLVPTPKPSTCMQNPLDQCDREGFVILSEQDKFESDLLQDAASFISNEFLF
jgi:hypothetical protein